jgi:hypothetical protein
MLITLLANVTNLDSELLKTIKLHWTGIYDLPIKHKILKLCSVLVNSMLKAVSPHLMVNIRM